MWMPSMGFFSDYKPLRDTAKFVPNSCCTKRADCTAVEARRLWRRVGDRFR
jgi:hypothetical protein